MEFETVLGPEGDDDDVPKRKLGQLAAPAQNLLDQHKATTVVEEKPGFAVVDPDPEPAKITDIAIQGESPCLVLLSMIVIP